MNNIKENHAEVKTSKWAIANFIFALLIIIGAFSTGFTFTNWFSFVSGAAFDVLFIWFFYYIMQRTKRKGMHGYRLAQIAFFVVTVFAVVSWISVIPLHGQLRSLNEFAVQTSPTFFGDDLATVKSYGDKNMVKLLSYDKEAALVKKEIGEVGRVSSCEFQPENTSSVKYGIITTFDQVDLGTTGTYGIRCYGENKPIDLQLNLKKENGKWIITTFNYDIELYPTEEDKKKEGEAK